MKRNVGKLSIYYLRTLNLGYMFVVKSYKPREVFGAYNHCKIKTDYIPKNKLKKKKIKPFTVFKT